MQVDGRTDGQTAGRTHWKPPVVLIVLIIQMTPSQQTSKSLLVLQSGFGPENHNDVLIIMFELVCHIFRSRWGRKREQSGNMILLFEGNELDKWLP